MSITLFPTALSQSDSDAFDTASWKESEPPRFLSPVQTQEAVKGEPIKFDAVVAGCPSPTITWFREGVPIPVQGRFKQLRDGNRYSLYVESAQPNDAGIFTCQAVNIAGKAVCPADLVVHGL